MLNNLAKCLGTFMNPKRPMQSPDHRRSPEQILTIKMIIFEIKIFLCHVISFHFNLRLIRLGTWTFLNLNCDTSENIISSPGEKKVKRRMWKDWEPKRNSWNIYRFWCFFPQIQINVNVLSSFFHEGKLR